MNTPVIDVRENQEIADKLREMAAFAAGEPAGTRVSACSPSKTLTRPSSYRRRRASSAIDSGPSPFNRYAIASSK